MAEVDHLLNEQRALARAWDDAAWAALANQGLLNRARRDLENSEAPVFSTEGGKVSASFQGHTIIIPPQGFAKARCSCPAPGVCHHILACGLALASSDGGAEPSTGALETVLELSHDDLRKWLGPASYRRCVLWLGENPASVEVTPARVQVRFEQAEVVLTPPHILEGAVASLTPGGRLDAKTAVAAAVLAVLAENGVPLPVLESSVSELHTSQKTLIANAERELASLAGSGFSHKGVLAAERLAVLADSALGEDLPRLGRLLDGLAAQVTRLNDRDGLSDSDRLMGDAAHCWALCTALTGSGHPDLRGLHQSRYEDVAELNLQGLGAWTWVSETGYHGLSLLFLNVENNEVLTWTESRPVGAGDGFRPRDYYGAGSLWETQLPLSTLSSAALRLEKARVSGNRRLSGSTKTRGFPSRRTRIGQHAIRSWPQLELRSREARPLGLASPSPWKDLVLVAPQRWDRLEFDQNEQLLRWWLLDEDGEAVAAQVAYSAETEPEFRHFAALKKGDVRDKVLSAVLLRTEKGLALRPVALLSDAEPAVNLGLDWNPQRAEKLPWVLKPFLRSREPELAEEGPSLRTAPGVEGRLQNLVRDVLERGCDHATAAQVGALADLVSELSDQGLVLLSAQLARTLEQGMVPREALRLRYMLDLHLQV